MFLLAPEPTAIWPTTVSGWVTLVTAISTALGSGIALVFAWGRVMERLNGYGKRLGSVEGEQERAKERTETLTRAVERAAGSMEELARRVGASEQKTDDCDDQMRQFAIDIGAKIVALDKSVGDKLAHVGERLAAVETELKIRNRRA